ncbi:hypothetical protein [Streptosporangium minutum]|uniref:Uncharacterized protein n=1 Tax=Streptosporangium minutum TaxID=569862 RepID=A0A243RBL5_9ACTN|nr:hypothetical protein [Streptosporangium minutum]OUC92069.1 hypothetical protein CA984_31480 [Streptosporangium minutum]
MTLPAYLARTNEDSVRATRRRSPQAMIELLARLCPELDVLRAARGWDAPAEGDAAGSRAA